MSQADQSIRPALSVEEWQHARDTKGEIDSLSFQLGCVQPDDFGAMAIANDRLPDDDPRKITREEVETVRHEAQRIASEWEPDEPAYRDAVILFALAAKLEALLPPE